MNTHYTVENLKIGSGVAFGCFGNKIFFTIENLEEMKNDVFIRKIYFNFDNSKICRVK